MSGPHVHLVSDMTERTRIVRIVLDPPESWNPSWREEKRRMIESVDVTFTDLLPEGPWGHRNTVRVRGRFLLKNGSLGAQTWSFHLWSGADGAVYERFIELARTVL